MVCALKNILHSIINFQPETIGWSEEMARKKAIELTSKASLSLSSHTMPLIILNFSLLLIPHLSSWMNKSRVTEIITQTQQKKKITNSYHFSCSLIISACFDLE
jgi:hypothetical protein